MVKVETFVEVNMKMTLEEAKFLNDIIGNVAGIPKLDPFYFALSNAIKQVTGK